jgi:hypothetical protein
VCCRAPLGCIGELLCTLQRQFREIERERFGPEVEVFENKPAARVRLDGATVRFDWFHIVARRAPDLNEAAELDG